MMADRTLLDANPGLLDAFPESDQKRLSKLRASPTAEILSACRTLLKDWPFDPERTKLALAPTIPLHCSDEFIIECHNLARDHDVGLHMHLAESRIQAVTGMKRHGKTLTAHLDELGFLEPSFTAAHGVWLDDDDLKRLADNGCSLAHNPGSDLRLGSGIAPARAAVSHRLNVGIGTDGSHCADNQNMFEAMRFASFASRIMSADTNEWLATDKIVAMATEGSARALGFGDDIGRLVPGAKADIVFLDLTNINFVPFNDPVNQIVHTEDSSAVQSVMVDGEFVLKDRRFTKINYEQLCHDVEDTVDRLQGANADARVIAENLEGMVSQFCVGLAGEPYHIHHWCGHTPSPDQ